VSNATVSGSSANAAQAEPEVTSAVYSSNSPLNSLKVEKVVEKTEFKVKLEKFDAAAKAKIIREIKTLIPGINLVEVNPSAWFVPT
jgi:large subunit ribosomal protein L7/L12